MIEQLLARAEADLEIATRRRDLAAALAADWEYWECLLNGGHEAVAATGQPAQAERAQDASACQQCGGPIPPSTRQGGRSRKFCSAKCGTAWHGKRAYERNKAAKAEAKRVRTEIELGPEPLGDLKPEERPLQAPDYAEDKWLQEQLKLPALPWEQRPETH
jgi:hypothetical protein